MQYAVSYTTRPPRDGEVDGLDYFFLTDEQFIEKIDANEWYEFVAFNGWYYGTSRDQMKAHNSVFIMTPEGMSCLAPSDRKDSLVIYLDIDEGIRTARMQQRGGNADSIERRIAADRVDFADYTDYDVKISDPYYNIQDLHNTIGSHLPLPTINFLSTSENFLPTW
jgi:guanylate kinase